MIVGNGCFQKWWVFPPFLVQHPNGDDSDDPATHATHAGATPWIRTVAPVAVDRNCSSTGAQKVPNDLGNFGPLGGSSQLVSGWDHPHL